ncbi:MAG TPA: hypothetical protein VHT03_11285 [Rhizomicrobium sp.]|jgi:hypothetical protein|nr:hypothetical protein [Rhizomicrobium sp.]
MSSAESPREPPMETPNCQVRMMAPTLALSGIVAAVPAREENVA